MPKSESTVPREQDAACFLGSLKMWFILKSHFINHMGIWAVIRIWRPNQAPPFTMKGKIEVSCPSSDTCDGRQRHSCCGSQIWSHQRRPKPDAGLACVLSGPSRPREAKRRPNLNSRATRGPKALSPSGPATTDRRYNHELHCRFAVSTEVGGPLV